MSYEGKSNIPVLRFPQFRLNWEEKALSYFMTFKNGINADKEQYGHGRKFINVLDVIADRPILHEQIIGSVNVSDAEFAKNEVKYGDILFQRSSETREEVGQSNVYLDKDLAATFGGFVIRGRPHVAFNPRYFDLLLKTEAVRKEITTRSGGSTRYNVSQDTLAAVKVVLTQDATEQSKVALFFDSIDKKINKLRHKHQLLETYKRGLMQKIFSQQIRFKQDDGSEFEDWKDRKLKSLGEFRGGGTPATNNKEYWNGDIPWVSSSDLSDGKVHKISMTRFITQEAINESATKIIPANSILIVSRVGIGKLAVCKQEVCTSQDFSNFTPTKDNVCFLSFLLKSKTSQLLSLAQGTSIKGFTNNELANLRVELPSPQEQKKIADCLSAFDKKVDAVANQISQLESFKQGLLQQMFV